MRIVLELSDTIASIVATVGRNMKPRGTGETNARKLNTRHFLTNWPRKVTGREIIDATTGLAIYETIDDAIQIQSLRLSPTSLLCNRGTNLC